jgi:hypothetical protein
MNSKEIAEQAGFVFGDTYWTEHDLTPLLERFAELVAAHEREECANIARGVAGATEPDDWALDKCNEIEHAIRARSKA